MTVVGVVAAVLLLALLASQIVVSGNEGRRSLDDRLEQRTDLAQAFIESYNADVIASVASHAQVSLSDAAPTEQAFDAIVISMRFKAAVLLDDQGRLLQIYPAKPEMLGKVMTGTYEHLRRALAGETAISDVVPSAAVGEPIVAFAVPFDSAGGRRVFSAGFSVKSTPLGAFLRNTASLPDQSVYIIDSHRSVVAASDDSPARTLDARDPDIGSTSFLTAESGRYPRGDRTGIFATDAIAGAPWRIVVTVPADSLYRPLEAGERTPWILFAVFFLVAVLGVLMARRLTEEHGDATYTALVDGLTGLVNRRHLDLELAALPKRLRPGTPWAVLMIDVDLFKAINDEHGHPVGDSVLRSLAATMRDATRPGDVVGRWGGEEFLVLLPGAGKDAAGLVAERIRKAIATITHHGLPVTVSIGYAATTDQGEHGDGLVDLADAALYRAKQAGRDRCATTTVEDAFPAARSSAVSVDAR